MDSTILCGMQFGDEGKGTFVDYLIYANNSDCIIKYNGGSQASHTVITPEGVTHKFSQLGSGMFNEKCHTYLTENMVVNLGNLLVEIEIFSLNTGIPKEELLDRIHIHENCYVVTPYHKLINKLRELSKGSDRRGTVGTGVSEVNNLLNEKTTFPNNKLGLQVKDIFNEYNKNLIIEKLKALQEYLTDFYNKNKKEIEKNIPEELKESLHKEINFLMNKKSYLYVANSYIVEFKLNSKLKNCIYSTYEDDIKSKHQKAIFEGSQGLLIDCAYGIKPNTTFLDTTNNFALSICSNNDKITKIGIAKSFCSRHGIGIFPTESTQLNSMIFDENQDVTFWNGKIRFGWFDAILFRYAQKVNKVDEVYLSSLDKLDNFDNIKICNEYLYKGVVDDDFKKIFEYYIKDKKVIITDIKLSNIALLGDYLKNITPIYINVKGWQTDTSNIKEYKELPESCKMYIKTLEHLINIPITLISVGPTRNEKIRMDV